MPKATATGEPGAPSDSNRCLTLDMLRGIAAVIVLPYHEANAYRLGGWYPGISLLSVDAFFCLSGFVIAESNYGRFAASLTVRDFMARRVYRLAAPYLLGWLLALLTMLVPSARVDAAGPSLVPTLLRRPLRPAGSSACWVLGLLIVLATGGLLLAAQGHNGVDISFP